MHGTSHLMQEYTHFIAKSITPKEKANEQNPYAVAIVKRTAGCTENQGSWARADR